MKKIFLSFVTLVVLSLTVQAQLDYEFWLACPDLNENHGGTEYPKDEPILLHLSTKEDPATVIISQPAMNWQSEEINIPANSSIIYYLTSRKAMLECVTPNLVENRGLYISSTALITAYYEVADKQNSDFIALKGKSALGTHFFITGQNRFIAAGDATFVISRFSCDIVATEDGTVVTIKPNKDVVGHPAGMPFDVTLNRGQTYSIQIGKQGEGEERPIGSEITSNNPIAMTIKDCSLAPLQGKEGDPLTRLYAADAAMDQSIPVENIGTEYIIPNGSLPNGDYYFLTATEDNTEIYLDGQPAPVATLQKGEVYKGGFAAKAVQKPATYIRTTKPIYVFQITGSDNSEVGGAILPSIICTGSSRIPFARSGKVGTTPSTSAPGGTAEGYAPVGFELTVFIRKGQENGLYLVTNNQPEKQFITLDIAHAFKDVPGNSDWVAVKKDLKAEILVGSSNVIYHKDGEPFHLGIITGDINTCRYGFFSDFKKVNVNMIADRPNLEYCEGDRIKLTATPYEGAYYTWIGPTNNIIQQGAFLNGKNTYYYQKAKITVSDTGFYKVVTKSGGCGADTSRIHITIYKNPQFQFGKDTTVCIGTKLFLDPAVSDLKYNWSTGDTTQAIYTNPNPGVTEYSLLIRNQYPNITCIASDTIVVTVSDIPAVSFMPSPYPSEGCGEATISFKNYTDPINAKFHWDFGDGTQSTEVNPVHAYTAVSGALSDTYDVTLIASNSSNCADTIKIDRVITMYRKPNAEFIYTPDVIHASNPVAKFIPASEEVPGFQYYWNFGDESTDTTYAPSHIYEAITAEYTVFYKVTNPLSPSCADSTSRPIKVINDSLSYTNVLTPNGDGINDVFIIKNLIAPNGVQNYGGNNGENTLYVYNRYGKRVFYAKDYQNNWEPKNLSDGTYFFIFKAKNQFNEKEYKGTITIIGSSGKD